MDSIQEQHERAVGDEFITWYNKHSGSAFVFYRRLGQAPDLAYRNGESEIQLEIVDCYYDEKEAALKWQNARGLPRAPQSWTGTNPDQKLLAHINERLVAKCAKSYGSSCVLVVHVLPGLTTAQEFEAMLSQVHLPPRNSFLAIYLTGTFPSSSDGSEGAYRCWKLSNDQA